MSKAKWPFFFSLTGSIDQTRGWIQDFSHKVADILRNNTYRLRPWEQHRSMTVHNIKKYVIKKNLKNNYK